MAGRFLLNHYMISYIYGNFYMAHKSFNMFSQQLNNL